MVTLVDYGLGNIQAFANIYKRLNIPVTVAQTADDLADAEKIILPGVGAFDWAMSRLEASGMRKCLDNLVLSRKRPVLGICVGMQMMANRSDEGELPGLNWINAEVRLFEKEVNNSHSGAKSEESGVNGKDKGRSGALALPHMGWNDVVPLNKDTLFKGLAAPLFYFLHSYYFSANDPSNVLATTDYNRVFSSAVQADNIFGVQFHPEKSHQWGVQLLKNFAEL